MIKKQLNLSTKPELKKKKREKITKLLVKLTTRQVRENMQVDILVCVFSQELLGELN